MTQEKFDNIYEKLDKDVEYANEVVRQTVDNQTKDIDNIMTNIYSDIISVEDPPTSVIERYFLELSNCLYFLGARLEKIGIYDDLSKAQAKEAYNIAYLNYSKGAVGSAKKPTVAEAQSSAEADVTYENMINTIYSRSYKIFKYKIESAQTMLSSLSKMLSKRMQDEQLAGSVKNGEIKQYLAETFKQFKE